MRVDHTDNIKPINLMGANKYPQIIISSLFNFLSYLIYGANFNFSSSLKLLKSF
jgi:hypothetical protein